jgi:hypothetical protein
LSLKAFGERLEEIWSRLEIMVEQMAKPEYKRRSDEKETEKV